MGLYMAYRAIRLTNPTITPRELTEIFDNVEEMEIRFQKEQEQEKRNGN
jgi:hypothetical protein